MYEMIFFQVYGGKKLHVGSKYFTSSVMKMKEKPQLWIFGHIHVSLFVCIIL
jgi:Icc-related predicted phosphoesterase